tara:strand:- start:313 stop:1434 length:1122 start_codon:yes stop_codon:yes gene_type:complete
MEELNLEDLNFDEAGINLFDDATGEAEKVETTETPAAGTTPAAEEKEIKPEGDETATAAQESVATQDKDKIQVQAGKTATGEAANSSSPKLNETEQLYSKLAAQFKAKGILPGLEDIASIKSEEDLNNAMKAEVASRYDAEQTAIKEAMKIGAPVSEVSEKMTTIKKLEGISNEYMEGNDNVEFRRTAIKQDFLDKGYGEERANTLAQRSIDAGTDVEDAKFAVTNIIATEKRSLEDVLENARTKESDSLKDIKTYIADTKEVIPGIALTDTQKDELYNQITTDVGNNKENAFMVAQKADPIGSRIKLETLFYLTKGLTDFSLFGNKAETKISNEIENLLRGANFTEEGKVNTSVPDANSTFQLADLKDFEIE